MNYLRGGLAVAAVAFGCSGAWAQWSGSGQLGMVSAHGNTNSQSANAKLDLSDRIGDWKHALSFNALYGQSENITSANRWDTAWQSNYKFSKRMFWFGGLRYEQDKFGAFSYQTAATTGLGYQVFDTKQTKLSVQFGLGIKRSEPQTLVKNDSGKVIQRIDGTARNRAVASGGIDFEHQLTDNTSLHNKFLVEATSDNTYMRNSLSLQVAMTDKLALSVGYELRENTSPPPDQHRLDAVTTLNLVYKID